MNKIINARQLPIISLAVFLSTSFQPIRAQDTILNKYGLWVIDKGAILQKTVAHNPAKAMLNLRVAVPGIVLDLRYASSNNFLHTPLYGKTTTTYLRKPAALALAKVQAALKAKGLGLKIYDAYRPYGATEKIWAPVQDERYASNPAKGSGHNRGTAVDLTLIQLATGKELPMGTGFDNFSDTAHHGFAYLPPAVLRNRLLLKELMEENGFKALDTEWWHYSLPDARNYELLDIDFAVLDAMGKKRRR